MLLTEISTEKSLEKKIYYLIILTLLTIKTQTLGSTHSHNSFESKISPFGRELMVNALSCKSLKHHMFWDWFETNLKFKLLVSSLTPTDYFMRHKLAIGIIWLAFCFLVFLMNRSCVPWSELEAEQKKNKKTIFSLVIYYLAWNWNFMKSMSSFTLPTKLPRQ